jgi:hypothetical protein
VQLAGDLGGVLADDEHDIVKFDVSPHVGAPCEHSVTARSSVACSSHRNPIGRDCSLCAKISHGPARQE